jgi:capsular polysaccharide biosynthesis protein
MVIVLVRTNSDTRPTKDVQALEQFVQAAVTRASAVAQLQLQRMDAAALSLREQVKLFSRCLLLVGDHGAGLSNAVFMPPGSAVVELTHASCGAHCGDYFRPVAELSGLTHRDFSGDNLTARHPEFDELLDRTIAAAVRDTNVAANTGTRQEF